MHFAFKCCIAISVCFLLVLEELNQFAIMPSVLVKPNSNFGLDKFVYGILSSCAVISFLAVLLNVMVIYASHVMSFAEFFGTMCEWLL